MNPWALSFDYIFNEKYLLFMIVGPSSGFGNHRLVTISIATIAETYYAQLKFGKNNERESFLKSNKTIRLSGL